MILRDKEAIEWIIEKLIINKFHQRKEDQDKELAELIHTFQKELDDLHNQTSYFNKPHIWHTVVDEKTLLNVWQKHYSLPYIDSLVKLHITLLLIMQGLERLREIENPSRAIRLGSIQIFLHRRLKSKLWYLLLTLVKGQQLGLSKHRKLVSYEM